MKMSFETDYDLLAEVAEAESKWFDKTVVKPYDRACEMAKQYGVYDAFRSLSPFYRVPVEILGCKNAEEVHALLSEYECMDANCE
jgi:hypothetical protein